MCTVIAATKERSVVVAFNRDERLDRPASPPQRLLDDPVAFGGRDDQEGGTWFGVTRDGFFAGVINRREDEPRDPERRSRGLLVIDVLRQGSVEAAGKLFAGLDSRLYNPFWMLIGDAEALRVATGGGGMEAVALEARGPGTQVLVSGPDEESSAERRRRVHAALPEVLARPWPRLAAELSRVLATHDREAPLRAPCIHSEIYGTRSSTIVCVEPGAIRGYLHADGPPCTHPYEDIRGRLAP